MNKPCFSMRGISKIYPGTIALHHVSLEVKKGEVHGIIGKNGAGKSTLVGIIAGMITPSQGEISLAGRIFETLNRIDSKKLGISIVPQEPQVILDATIAENLFIPDYVTKGRFIDWPGLNRQAGEILHQAGLDIDARAKAGDLSMSEQQLLLVVKACYVEKSKIIILDEASASLTTKDQKILYGIIKERKAKGNTIIFISHRTDELLEVCDRVTVLRDGRSITTANCADLDKAKLSALIVGEDSNFCDYQFEKTAAGKVFTEQEMVMSVENLSRVGVFQNVSFQVYQGEILGIAGIRGSGRTEILKGITGIEPVDSGCIKIGQKKVSFAGPSQAFQQGIVYLPEDRESEGLIGNMSIRGNMTLNGLYKIFNKPFIDRQKEKTVVEALVSKLEIKIASIEQEASQLSGGNKQKVVVGKIMAMDPKVFLLDEPTRGIDIAAKEGILRIIKEELVKSAAVVITSPGVDDLVMVCDRILVLYQGQIVGEYHKGQFSEEEIFNAIQGASLENLQPGDEQRQAGCL